MTYKKDEDTAYEDWRQAQVDEEAEAARILNTSCLMSVDHAIQLLVERLNVTTERARALIFDWKEHQQ